ncbi:phosphoesterase, PA-phosphatase related [Fischerella sp. NIES-3754]|nr:phosphoesterase, PA-phosphatase related [Fischerella sp. NIES-3754]BCX06796.1 MAG: hypothetical protein KatS3mg066_0655 [Fischerella sp.]
MIRKISTFWLRHIYPRLAPLIATIGVVGLLNDQLFYGVKRWNLYVDNLFIFWLLDCSNSHQPIFLCSLFMLLIEVRNMGL